MLQRYSFRVSRLCRRHRSPRRESSFSRGSKFASRAAKSLATSRAAKLRPLHAHTVPIARRPTVITHGRARRNSECCHGDIATVIKVLHQRLAMARECAHIIYIIGRDVASTQSRIAATARSAAWLLLLLRRVLSIPTLASRRSIEEAEPPRCG